MTDYREIYNDIVNKDRRYNLAENSPGLRSVIQATDQLLMVSGRSLDVGCGVGFVVEYLSSPAFNLQPFGCDVSDEAIKRAKARLMISAPGSINRLFAADSQKLPFEDDFFSLVTCFDVLEHLDPPDVDATWSEISRVLKRRGIFMGSVSVRPSGVNDKFGHNLHRTVESVDWWIDRLSPDRAEYDASRSQLMIWKRFFSPHRTRPPAKKQAWRTEDELDSPPPVAADSSLADAESPSTRSNREAESIGHDSRELYQQIYDEHSWYGNAAEGRCPGVRLLPEYIDWLQSPVMDLGCGRGQTVELLRQQGFEAEGIDQIRNHPDMRVGDITQPIADLERFKSVICVDCIEHLRDEQLDGLFENMKRVKRQAFSIHNGESTTTGRELHVNRKSFKDWYKLIRAHFDIAAAIQIEKEQMLYLTQSRKDG